MRVRRRIAPGRIRDAYISSGVCDTCLEKWTTEVRDRLGVGEGEGVDESAQLEWEIEERGATGLDWHGVSMLDKQLEASCS